MSLRAAAFMSSLVAASAAACAAPPAPASAPALGARAAEVLPEDATAKITKACFVDNDPMACGMLATLFQEGMLGYQKDPKRADELFARMFGLQRIQCERGDAEQCAMLGGLMAMRLRRLPEGDPEIPRLAETVIPLLETGCRGGEGLSCDALGEIYESGRGVQQDPARARTLYQSGCDAGSSTSCGSLADMLRRDGDKTGAAAAYIRGCDAGVADAATKKDIPPPPRSLVPGPPWWTELCHTAGYLVFSGEGVAADARRAGHYYKLGCDGGSAGACTGLGTLTMRGSLGPVDAKAAAALLRKGCDNGDAGGCTLLGHLHDVGEGVAKDATRARELLKKGCDGGDERGCSELRRLDGPNRMMLSPGSW